MINKQTSNNFLITGVGGYIAPRHLMAIKETNNNLIAAFDPNDSVGILDSYFPNALYFKDYERFERFISKRSDIDYLSICSPNYLHDTQIRLALLNNINAICEKPIVLFPHNLDFLEKLEEKSNKSVYTIMQLRYHPQIISLKQKIKLNKKYEIELKYITPRGNWYHYSWKGDETKSGGIVMNIGIHLFDLMIYLFGKAVAVEVNQRDFNKASGYIEFDNAFVKWFLSIDENDLPNNFYPNKRTLRIIKIDNEEIEFSDGFQDLHTLVYQNIFVGKGLRIKDARPSIELVDKIRNAKIKR